MNNNLAGDIVSTSLRVGAAIAEAIVAAIAAGDTSTLEQLERVLPHPDILRARDLALKEQQRKRAHDLLDPK